MFKMSLKITIISVLMRLHNLCVDRRVADAVYMRDRTWGRASVSLCPDLRWHSSSDIWLAGAEHLEDSEEPRGRHGGRRNLNKPSHTYRRLQTELLSSKGILRLLRPRQRGVVPDYAVPATYEVQSLTDPTRSIFVRPGSTTVSYTRG